MTHSLFCNRCCKKYPLHLIYPLFMNNKRTYISYCLKCYFISKRIGMIYA